MEDDDNILNNPELNKEIEMKNEEKIKKYIPMILKASKEGDLEKLNEAIDNNVDIDVKDNKNWTPIIWASCYGHLEIVKTLINLGVYSNYIYSEEKASSVNLGKLNNEYKITPLQWACYKGHYKIVNILLDKNLNWKDWDKYNNNCFHLACSSNSFETVIELLQKGVVINKKNCRGHKEIELTTNTKILKILKDYYDKIGNIIPGFDHNIYYLCKICYTFYDGKECIQEKIYETFDSIKPEIFENKCLNCSEIIKGYEDKINEIIKIKEIEKLIEIWDEINEKDIKINLKLLKNAQEEKKKLLIQIELEDMLKNLVYIENYKTIKKSIEQLNKKKNNAFHNNIYIENWWLDKIKKEISRLIAERNLRYFIDNIDYNFFDDNDTNNLNELLNLGNKKEVNNEYLEIGKKLENKLNKIKYLQNTIENYKLYTERNFPPDLVWDRRGKRYIDPITNKPFDPKKPRFLPMEKPKKKKKKDPNEIKIPKWAEVLEELEKVFKKVDELLVDEDVTLNNENSTFLKNKQIVIKKEINYRKQLEKDQKIIDEHFNKNKKKK